MTQGTSRRCREVPGTAQVIAGKHQSCRTQQWGFFLDRPSQELGFYFWTGHLMDAEVTQAVRVCLECQ